MPLVLVMGIGAQRVFWSDEFCKQFVAAGFQVVRFDHRDIGESTRMDLPTPKPLPLVARTALKLPVAAPYSLSDMANDVVGLMDHLGWKTAHFIGVSMGGMVVQHLALEHPERVRSITAIMTTPGGRRYIPKPRAFGALFAKSPQTAEAAGEHAAKMFGIIGSTAWPTDVERLKAIRRDRVRARDEPARVLAALRGRADVRRSPREARVDHRPGAGDPRLERSDVPVERGPEDRNQCATWYMVADRRHGTRFADAAMADDRRGGREARQVCRDVGM